MHQISPEMLEDIYLTTPNLEDQDLQTLNFFFVDDDPSALPQLEQTQSADTWKVSDFHQRGAAFITALEPVSAAATGMIPSHVAELSDASDFDEIGEFFNGDGFRCQDGSVPSDASYQTTLPPAMPIQNILGTQTTQADMLNTSRFSPTIFLNTSPTHTPQSPAQNSVTAVTYPPPCLPRYDFHTVDIVNPVLSPEAAATSRPEHRLLPPGSISPTAIAEFDREAKDVAAADGRLAVKRGRPQLEQVRI